MDGVLIVKLNTALSNTNVLALYNEIIKQKDNGLIILPPYCTPIFIPNDCNIVIDNNNNTINTNNIPPIIWNNFNKNELPIDLDSENQYLILIRHSDDGKTWMYSMDVATPWGNYIDDFWDTTNDWIEGKSIVNVVAYAELPYGIKEKRE